MKTNLRKLHPVLIVLAVIVIALISTTWGSASLATQSPTPEPTPTAPGTDLAIGSTDGITWLAAAIFLVIIIPIVIHWKRVEQESLQTETP